MREFFKRGGWLFLVLLFVITGLGVGVYAFVADTHSNGNDYISCPLKPLKDKQQKKDGKYAGAKLVDFTPVQHISYVQCQDIKVGTGATATATSTISANYTGAVASTGEIFQSSLDSGQPLTNASLSSGVIAGWTAGIPGMKVGGTRRLLIPAQYAYGANPPPGIPVNADLVFDVTLLSVK
ncbi:MAG TPA: FKBP-type peptidyl-prolyl cis-trans isomerase [Candidatus Saccharimonadales bacterium]|nr:FKBP-type peptidyl-prolyl cis-trans isomerase [Candidatus Saccharimonadales bacterium]